MNFAWNIRVWIERFLPYFLRNAVLTAWLYVLLKPVDDLHALFLAKSTDIDDKTKYTGQQRVLAELLNKKFGSTRIYITTDSDTLRHFTAYSEAEAGFTERLYSEAEPNRPAIVYSELNSLDGRFTVHVPSSLSVSEVMIKGWVNYYRIAGTSFTIRYF
jgi:hypothetical protein